jgi:rod shape-determining protein MreB and related proteins
MGSKKIAIDLGTVNSLVMVQDKGIVVNEPSVVAFSRKEKKVIAVGKEAWDMLGKSPREVVVKRPLSQGVIASYRLTKALLAFLMRKALGRYLFGKSEVMVSVPAGLTSVEERAVIEAVTQSGAGKVYLIPEPLAASMGADMPVDKAAGNMIVNMGGGTIEIAVVSLNGLVNFESKRLAGDSINQEIMSYVKKQYNLYLGERMAEQVKMEIGSAIKMKSPLEIEVRGSDTASSMPRMIKLNSNDLVSPINQILLEIIQAIKIVLEKTPPELASDIIDQGIALTGGTSLIRNIDILFTEALDIPVFVVDNPIECTVRGVYKALQNVNYLMRSLRTVK